MAFSACLSRTILKSGWKEASRATESPCQLLWSLIPKAQLFGGYPRWARIYTQVSVASPACCK